MDFLISALIYLVGFVFGYTTDFAFSLAGFAIGCIFVIAAAIFLERAITLDKESQKILSCKEQAKGTNGILYRQGRDNFVLFGFCFIVGTLFVLMSC